MEAFAVIRRMIGCTGTHCSHPYIPHDEPAEFNYEKLVNFRPVIQRILLQNSQSIVRGIWDQHLELNCRSNDVRNVFYTFSIFF